MIQQTKEFKPFKQHDRSSCVACVAAMITRTSPEDFVRYVQALHPLTPVKPPYSDIDLAKFLLEFEIIMGAGAPVLSKGQEGEIYAQLIFDVSLFPAYVSVKSERDPRFEHAVFWDGKKIWDPNPNVPDGRDPLSYAIVGWWPLVQVRGKPINPGV